MAKISIENLDGKTLLDYFKGNITGVFFAESVKKYKEFQVHSDGCFPEDLIKTRRPNEPDQVCKYRCEVWEPITKPTFSKVFSCLSKIRRSSDWAITYPNESFPKIVEGETLEDYCESDFPHHASVTNWAFDVLLKQYLIDPNAVVFVFPDQLTQDETTYLEPFPYIYNSCDVLEFESEEYAILKVNGGIMYRDRRGNLKQGDSFYFVTRNEIYRYDQVDEKRNFAISFEFVHNLDFLVVFKLKGIISKSNGSDYLYESKISGMLPHLNEACKEYSDLQAAKVLNIYPERWEISQNECPVCKGSGSVPNSNWRPGDNILNRNLRCPNNCSNGYMPSGPFTKIVVKPSAIGEQQMPNPPAGYIDKDTGIVTIMDASVDKHQYSALAAINFQFLDQVPQNQSGVAKEVDKDELNNTVHSIAEDIISCIDKVYKSCAYFRYYNLYSTDDIDEMLPKIPVPEHFDLISSAYRQQEIAGARNAKMNPLLIGEMEVEFASSRFGQDDELNTIMKIINDLDPMPAYSEDEKMTILSNAGVTKQNYIITSNIIPFVRRALFEDKNFSKLERDKQMEVLNGYAEEQIQASNQDIINSDANGGNADGFQPGDSVSVIPGNEQSPSHVGQKMKVTSVNNDAVQVQLADGSTYDGYATDDLQSDNSSNQNNQ